MRRLVLKRLQLFFLVTCTFPVCSFAQTITGIWRGYFITNSGENYSLEFQVKEDAGVAVSGVSYSYLKSIFYGKATMTGSFVKSSSNFRIREIKTVEVKNMGFGGTCIMNYDLVYSRSGKEEFLEGTYLGKQEVKEGENPYEWGDCGGGKVYLRRVTTSDFYIEPFLRNNTAANRPPAKPPVSRPPQNKPLTPPPVVKTVPRPKTTVPKTTVPKKAPAEPKKNNESGSTVVDSAIAKTNDIKKAPAVKPPVVTPNVLRTRQNELMRSLVVNNPNVTIKLYDNGEIDDDSISVYLDKKLVLTNQRLTASPLVIKLKMDEENPNHELIMVAENLGRIPPNTSLMVVEAGDQRFDVRITSTEQKNALVRFRYEKP